MKVVPYFGEYEQCANEYGMYVSDYSRYFHEFDQCANNFGQFVSDIGQYVVENSLDVDVSFGDDDRFCVQFFEVG